MTSKSFTIHYTVTADILAQASCSWVKEVNTGYMRWFRYVRVFLIYVGVLIFMNAALQFLFGENYVDTHYAGAVVGAAFGYFMFFFLVWLSQRKLRQLTMQHLEKVGESTAVFTANSVRVSDSTASAEFTWYGFDAINAVKDATVLRAGGMQYPIPNSALPEGLTPDAFRAQLQEWKDAKHEVVE